MHPVVLVAVFVLIASAVFAAELEDHKSHHPEAATASNNGPALMPKMDLQMKAMHDNMANAKTPEARRALMAEHMKTMQAGASLMTDMGGACHDQMMETMMPMMMDQLSVQSSQPCVARRRVS